MHHKPPLATPFKQALSLKSTKMIGFYIQANGVWGGTIVVMHKIDYSLVPSDMA